jgi:hypothetical protein
MRLVIVIVVALGCSSAVHAQDAGDEAGQSAVEERELTRAERRALRREQEAAEAAGAAAQSTDQETTASATDEDDEGLICRREAVTGSHRRVRICTTREQREAMRASSAEVLRDVTRNRAPLGPEGG